MEPRIDAVILDSPFVSPQELLHHHAAIIPGAGPLAADYLLWWMSLQTNVSFFNVSAERAVAKLNGRPLLIIHGERDVGMPKTHAQRLHDAATGPRDIWFGPGTHSNIVTTDPSVYEKRLQAFLKVHLPPIK
jgi:pimeloyl-ACP methyl ester carboxylesterase